MQKKEYFLSNFTFMFLKLGIRKFIKTKTINKKLKNKKEKKEKIKEEIYSSLS